MKVFAIIVCLKNNTDVSRVRYNTMYFSQESNLGNSKEATLSTEMEDIHSNHSNSNYAEEDASLSTSNGNLLINIGNWQECFERSC